MAWGFDPSGELLEQWGIGDTPDGLDRFADIALEAAVGTVGLVKMQSAFYERHGWRGIRTLQRSIAEARSAGLLVIADAKRGDVGTTNDAYAEAFLGDDAPLGIDALTVHPYLGLRAMDPFVTRAHRVGSCLFVVTRSSNPEGRAVQSATEGSGLSVEAALLRDIGAWNSSLVPGAIGPIGAVIGPTHMKPELDLPGAQGLFLAPGIGAQGATRGRRGRGVRLLPGSGDSERLTLLARRRPRSLAATGDGVGAGRRVPCDPPRLAGPDTEGIRARPWQRSSASRRARRSPSWVALRVGASIYRLASSSSTAPRDTADVVLAFFTREAKLQLRLDRLGSMVFPSGGRPEATARPSPSQVPSLSRRARRGRTMGTSRESAAIPSGSRGRRAPRRRRPGRLAPVSSRPGPPPRTRR